MGFESSLGVPVVVIAIGLVSLAAILTAVIWAIVILARPAKIPATTTSPQRKPQLSQPRPSLIVAAPKLIDQSVIDTGPMSIVRIETLKSLESLNP